MLESTKPKSEQIKTPQKVRLFHLFGELKVTNYYTSFLSQA